MRHPAQAVKPRVRGSWRTPAGLLPGVHSAEQAAASLATVLARRVHSCDALTLRELLCADDSAPAAPAAAELGLWRALLRACAGAHTLHVCVGRGAEEEADTDEAEEANRRAARALLGALPR